MAPYSSSGIIHVSGSPKIPNLLEKMLFKAEILYSCVTERKG